MAIGRSDSYRRVHQGILEEVINKIFEGNNNIVTNARKETTIKSPFSSYFLELDIWVSNLNLCFEFQDDYHYTPTWYSQVSLEQIQEHDSYKRDSTVQKNITLIIVPCWWDGEQNSLISSIKWHRPDLFKNHKPASPIPLNPPFDFFDNSYIPDVGKLMLSSFTSTPDIGNTITSKNFWWVGEKYDGLRICWHPYHNTLYSRSGNKLEIPPVFSKHFPKVFLDGELWFGRGNFIEAQGVLYPSDVVTEWATMRIVPFDDSRANEETEFEHRYQHVLEHTDLHNPFITIATRIKGAGKQQVYGWLKGVIEAAGEGIILRRPRSLYVRGRSPSLVKLKASRADKEGLVMKVNRASLTLLLADGVTFEVPAESISLKRWPKRGEIVSFSYDNYSRFSIPIHAKVYRIRKDVSWQDVLNNASAPSNRLNDISKAATGVKSESEGFKVSEKGKNLRMIFEKFARINNMDPLVVDSWYTLAHKFLKLKIAKTLLARFKGSFINAVKKTFPELTFDETKFHIAPRNFWKSIQNKRNFMIKFAAHKGFDPLVPENWYTVTPQEFMTSRAARTLLRYTSFPAAIQNAFPEIGIQSARFSDYPYRFYLNSNNRKKFFLEFARYHNFDPLVASNWYSISHAQILHNQGEYALQHYNGNFVKALCVLFPQLKFEENKFVDAPKRYISVPEATKRFFTKFAQSQEFDPLIPDNWYSVPTSIILAFTGSQEIMHHYSRSVIRALMSVYPNIEEDKFACVPRQYWSDKTRRRQFFLEFADKHGFDPLIAENWYPITTPMFFSTKGYSLLGKYYKKSVKAALEDLLPEVKFDRSKFIQLL